MLKAKKSMSKTDIYCKIELVKDKNTGKMMVTAHLNPQAPNIITNEQSISWTPTFEEQHFLMDAIALLKKQQDQPIVTFTKKNSTYLKNEQSTNNDTIETINQTIDKLPTYRNQLETDKTPAHKTIEHIIKQKTKQDL